MSILPGYADRVGPKLAFDKVAELVGAPSSPENDKDLKIVVQGLCASYPGFDETAKAVDEVKAKRPDIAAQVLQPAQAPS
ncbi:MAG: hypothetical protein DI586_02555 [Micavibrio aeruginosavorus]|uniref:Uncharacterized protein n=1 Tax=Micavibrio aeruginosavorus TaxID=349221 RepID=A0A2W5FQV0_9BACT|nr:MAG: hypothetical protein DI586_02555 [Micavibrio aeruginosavorus]